MGCATGAAPASGTPAPDGGPLGALEAVIVDHVEAIVDRSGIARVGIMGGTFDPIHIGHTALADAAMDELGLDCMVYIPAGIPSFKRDRRIAPGADRLAMVRLAIGGRPACFASGCEVFREGVTYTADTLDLLARELPGDARLFLVMGADAFATLPEWHRADDVARRCDIVWAARAGQDRDAARVHVSSWGVDVEVHELRARIPRVSSTELRGLLGRGQDVGALVSPEVLDYIRRRGLYGWR